MSNGRLEIDMHPMEVGDSKSSHKKRIQQSLYPRRIGKTIALMYRNGSPLIIIGPDCTLPSTL